MPKKEEHYLGNPLLKRSNIDVELTQDQFIELAKCADDPIYFAKNYIKIVTLNEGLVNFKPFPFQEEMLKNFHEKRFNICKLPRQSGKSTTAVAFLIHNMLFDEHTSIAILANKAQTAKEILSRLQTAYENLPKWIQQGVKSCNKTSMELENGSKVIAASTSASAVRGGTYSLLMLDEYAFVPEQIANNFMRSVYPTISSGDNSKVIVVSCVTKDTYLLTPSGYRKIERLIDEKKEGAYFTNEYTVMGRDKFYSSNIIVNNGKSTTNIIKTRYEELECSENHKLWAYKNGRYDYFKSSELDVGDYIALKYNTQVFGNNDYVGYYPEKGKNKNHFSCSYINEDIAYFVGLYISEGYARDHYSKSSGNLIGGQIVISCGDDISESLSKLDLKFRKIDDVHYIINSKNLVGFLKELGFNVTKKAPSKTIPDKVLSWSKQNITALLRGMFDGDGGITKRGRIHYSSTSRELIRQVQLLLSNLGILGSIYKSVTPPTKKVKVYSTVYTIEIEGRFSLIFKDQIGFGLKRKKDLFSYIKIPSRTGHPTDVVPESALTIIKNGNKEIEKLYLIPKRKKKVFTTFSRSLLLEHKSKIYPLADVTLKEFFDDNVDKNLIWLKIKDIQKSENEVFDVSLPDVKDDKWCHSVLYNNFLGHQTPQGMNHFYNLWMSAKKGKNGYHPFEIHWSDVPGRDEKWKQQQIANTSEKDFNQEFNTEFLGSTETLISGQKLVKIHTSDPLRSINSLDVYEEPKEDHVYVTLVDTARGVEKDYHAFVIIDITNNSENKGLPAYNIVAKYKNNEIKPEMYSNVVKDIASVYNQSFLLCEVNDIGNQVAKDLIEDGYPNMLLCSTKARSGQFVGQNFSGKYELGVKMQKNVKKIGCIKLKTLIEENILFINDRDIFAELTTFVQKGSTFEAEAGKNDDLVMCLVMFSWLTTNQYFKDLVDDDLRKRLLQEKKDQEESDILPFGFAPYEEEVIVDEKTGNVWQVVEEDEMNAMLNLFNYY
jgi:intein/homing endonuclease